MAVYRLFIKHSAEQDLRRLPRVIFQRVNTKILTLRVEPRPPGVRKLTGPLEGWRIRVGDYRILYQVDDTEQTVTVVRVRHQRDVYR